MLDAFVPFGEVADVTLPKPELPSSTDPHRGFGYVEFELAADAKEAVDNMDQSELFGRVIKVAPAKPQKESNEGLGSKTAVWEQVSVMQSTSSIHLAHLAQEGWLAKHAVNEEDRLAAEQQDINKNGEQQNPMQAIEDLDVAGPKRIS